MQRVICHCCRGRGHFRRDCPFSNRSLLTTLSDAYVEGVERLPFVEIGDEDDDPAKSRRLKKRQSKSAAPQRLIKQKERENPEREARYTGKYCASAVGAQAAPRKGGDPGQRPRSICAEERTKSTRSAESSRTPSPTRASTASGRRQQPAASSRAPKGNRISRDIITLYGRREPRYKHRSAGEPAQ